MQSYSPTITIMIKSLRRAAKSLMRDYYEIENLQVSKNSLDNFVSIAFKNSEKFLKSELLRAKPTYGFLKVGDDVIENPEDSSLYWIYDPLDGWYNFLHSGRNFSISLALVNKNSLGGEEVIASVIEAPALKETYLAEKGKGAWLEREDGFGSRLKVAGRKDFKEILFGIGSIKSDYKDVFEFLSETADVRIIGSTSISLAMVASGKFDCYINNNLRKNESCAGSLIVTEAGGVISNYKGQNKADDINVVAGNDNMHKQIISKFT